MSRLILVAGITAGALLFPLAVNSAAQAANVELVRGEGKVTVLLDGERFTEYVYEGHTKPILYPIIGPYGVEMTRNYPMKKDVDNEADDHPHHESLWFTHDGVNGANFWSAHPSRVRDGQRTARAVQTSLTTEEGVIRSENEWRDAEDHIVCTDSRVIGFGKTGDAPYIDYQITIHASHGDVTFADTKEGTMAIRTHPRLRLSASPRNGNHTAEGHAVNSEGDKDAALWGKRAKWVDYWGPVDGRTVGIAVFDHPDNPRHPTWWHARTYGLVAANPFGIHDFENKPAGVGEMVVKDGTSVAFRYRFVFHEGDAATAKIEEKYAEFATPE